MSYIRCGVWRRSGSSIRQCPLLGRRKPQWRNIRPSGRFPLLSFPQSPRCRPNCYKHKLQFHRLRLQPGLSFTDVRIHENSSRKPKLNQHQKNQNSRIFPSKLKLTNFFYSRQYFSTSSKIVQKKTDPRKLQYFVKSTSRFVAKMLNNMPGLKPKLKFVKLIEISLIRRNSSWLQNPCELGY